METRPAETRCAAGPATGDVEVLDGREVVLGTRGMHVTRTLPNRDRRMVGAWCFVDQYGPAEVGSGPGMRVPPHPHTGLQTVSWLVEGEVLHHDSLGNARLVRPGGLNLMTAGRGIAHAEQTPPEHSPVLHGVQLWIALPERSRHVAPAFAHHAALPTVGVNGGSVTVIAGELAGARSPATTYSPLIGAQVDVDGEVLLPLRADFEHAVLGLTGTASVAGVGLDPGPLLYLGAGRTTLAVRGEPRARLLLLGGEPFTEEIVMWWNFIARSHEEMVALREEWETGDAFGVVTGYPGGRLGAPPMPTTALRPRGRTRDR